MFDHILAFYQPASIPEAIKLITKLRGAKVLAGATDLALHKDRSTRYLIDVTRAGLDYLRVDRNGCVIGACVTMGAAERSPKIRALANGILVEAIATCGSIQLRNTATIGGNLANASPAADTATPLLVLDAAVVLQSARGKQKMPLEKFFAGPHRTALKDGLLIEIQVPAPKPNTTWSFQKLGRTETDISIVNVAAGLAFGKAGEIVDARIALGSVGPTPFRARAAEAALLGKKLDEAVLDGVCEKIRAAVKPISDIRASAEYRREMAAVFTVRALRQCAERGGAR